MYKVEICIVIYRRILDYPWMVFIKLTRKAADELYRFINYINSWFSSHLFQKFLCKKDILPYA